MEPLRELDELIERLIALRNWMAQPEAFIKEAAPMELIDAALAIIRIWEGDTWGTHRSSGDSTLAYGILGFRGDVLMKVIERYREKGGRSLRMDAAALDAAAGDPIMREAQMKIAREYLSEAARISIIPRRVKTALGQLLLLDMAVNHGLRHGFIQAMEERANFARFVNGEYEKRDVREFPGGERAWVRELSIARWELLSNDVKLRSPGLRERYAWFTRLAEEGNYDLTGNLMIKGRPMNPGVVQPLPVTMVLLPLAKGGATPPAAVPPPLLYGSPLDPNAPAGIPPGWKVSIRHKEIYKFPPAFRGTTHVGVDLVRETGDTFGAPVFAVADGVVTHAGNGAGEYDSLIVIKHPDGMSSLYGHLSRAIIAVGQGAIRGQLIGHIGDEEGRFGAHLHWMMARTDILQQNPFDYPNRAPERIDRDYVDPLLWVEERAWWRRRAFKTPRLQKAENP